MEGVAKPRAWHFPGTGQNSWDALGKPKVKKRAFFSGNAEGQESSSEAAYKTRFDGRHVSISMWRAKGQTRSRWRLRTREETGINKKLINPRRSEAENPRAQGHPKGRRVESKP